MSRHVDSMFSQPSSVASCIRWRSSADMRPPNAIRLAPRIPCSSTSASSRANSRTRCGCNDKEVRRNDGFGVVSHKGHPALRWICPSPRGLRDVSPDGSWGSRDSPLEQKLVGNTFLTPCWIVRRHFTDPLPDVGRHAWPAARPRFPSPEQMESFAAPTNQRVGLDDGECVLPVEQSGKIGEQKQA